MACLKEAKYLFPLTMACIYGLVVFVQPLHLKNWAWGYGGSVPMLGLKPIFSRLHFQTKKLKKIKRYMNFQWKGEGPAFDPAPKSSLLKSGIGIIVIEGGGGMEP